MVFDNFFYSMFFDYDVVRMDFSVFFLNVDDDCFIGNCSRLDCLL